MNREYSRRLEPMGFSGARVYVGDIGHRIRRQDLQKEFEQYGQVLDVWMTPGQNDGRFRDKKFAFVVFRYAEDADIAVRDKNGRQVCGRRVVVEHAKPPKSQMVRNQDYHRYRGGYGGQIRGRGGFSRGGFSRGGYHDYQGSRQYPPQTTRYRSRSFSPKGYHHRSPPPYHQPVRKRKLSSDGDYHQYQRRSRNDSFSNHSPERPMDRQPRHMDRQSSFSPEQHPRKSSRPAYRSPSETPSPPRKPQEVASDSYSSRTPSPRPKKVKRKKKKQQSRSRTRSRSRDRSVTESPVPEPEPEPLQEQYPPQQQYYSSEEGEYKKPAKSHKSKKSKSKKKKKRELESGEEYSSDDS